MSNPIPSWIPSEIDFSVVDIPSIIDHKWSIDNYPHDAPIPSVIKLPPNANIPSKITVPIPSELNDVWPPTVSPEDLAISVDIPTFAEAITKVDFLIDRHQNVS